MADRPDSQKLNRYQQIMEHIFFARYQEGAREVPFEREDMVRAAQELGISLPKNLGDITYTFRYRGQLPESIRLKRLKERNGSSDRLAGHDIVSYQL